MRGLRRVVNARGLGDVLGGAAEAVSSGVEGLLGAAERSTYDGVRKAQARRCEDDRGLVEDEMRRLAEHGAAVGAAWSDPSAGTGPVPHPHPSVVDFDEDPVEVRARTLYESSMAGQSGGPEWSELDRAGREPWRHRALGGA